MATASVTSAALMMAGMLRYDRADCGGPMHTVSSASSTCLVLKSAVECTATVLMPSSRQARRIRRAISRRLADLARLAVLGEHGRDPSRFVGLDLVHHLHGFDNAQDLPDLDFAADFD